MTDLDLQGCPELDDSCVWALHGLPHTRLNIGGTLVGDSGLRSLRRLPLQSLAFMEFDRAEVSGRGFTALGKLSGLVSLELSEAGSYDHNSYVFGHYDFREEEEHFKFDSLRGLQGMKSLTRLSVNCGFQLSDKGYQGLIGMPLTSLYLKNCFPLSKDEALCLVGMPLKSLRLHFSNRDSESFADGAWGILSSLPLTSLTLTSDHRADVRDDRVGSCAFSDACLDALCVLPLTDLYTSGWGDFETILDEGMGRFRNLPMTSLHLDFAVNEEMTDQGIANLSGIPLESLVLHGTENVCGRGLGGLLGAPLTILELWDCQITDQGMACLKGLPLLVHLKLECCNAVSDEGLLHLKDSKVARLYMYDTVRITLPGVQAALSGLPLKKLLLEAPSKLFTLYDLGQVQE